MEYEIDFIIKLLNELNETESFNEKFIKDFSIKYNIKQNQTRFLISTIVIRRHF